MKKGLFTLLLLITTALPALAAPTNTTGPWGINIATFTSLSSAKRSPVTANKTMVITKAMDCNNLTISEDRTLDIKKGGRIRYSGNLVILGHVADHGPVQIFEQVGAGTLTFGNATRTSRAAVLRPEYWNDVQGSDSTAAFRALGAAITDYSNIILSRAYYVFQNAAEVAANGPVWTITGRTGVKVSGGGRVYTSSAITLDSTLISITNSTNIAFENLSFYGGLVRTGYTPIGISDEGTNESHNISLKNIVIDKGLSGVRVSPWKLVTEPRSSGFTFDNVRITDTEYGLSFQGNGDDVTIRGLVANGCKRSYYPWNVRNHDVQMESAQGGAFTDVMIKAYSQAGYYNTIENIKLDYSSPTGRHVNAEAHGTNEAVVGIEAQFMLAGDYTPAVIRDIKIHLNVSAAISSVQRQTRSVVRINKWTAQPAAVMDNSPRGHAITGLDISGTVLNAQNLLSNAIKWCDLADWTGENITNSGFSDFTISGDNGLPALIDLRGQNASTPTGFYIRDSFLLPAVEITNDTGKPVEIHKSYVAGTYKRKFMPSVTYTPTIKSGVTLGNGTLSGTYQLDGDYVDFTIKLVLGSSSVVTGPILFDLPVPITGSATYIAGDAQATGMVGQAFVQASDSSVRVYNAVSSIGYVWGVGVPKTWATSDIIQISARYPQI